MLYRFQDFELDPKRFQLRRKGEPVPVRRQVFDLILFLARNHERPVTRNELVSHVWGGRTVSDGSLSRCLSLARKALGDNPRQHRFIKTLHGRGYWFVAPVEVVVESGVQPPGGRLPRDMPFVGRVDEMSMFLQSLESGRQSRGSIALIYGAAGIGKSRFCRELTLRARALGYPAAFVDCAALGSTAPLAPWIEAVRRLSAGGPRDQVLSLTAPSSADEMAPEWERLRRFALLADLLLKGVADDSVLTLALDNIDRADSDSRLFLRFLSDLVRSSRVVVVVSARFDRDSGISAFEEDVRRAEGWQASLSPLSSSEVEALLSQLGLGGDEVDSSRLLSRSGGNPLFVEQLLADRSEESQVPASLVGAVLRRVGELPEEPREVLRQLSILGKHFHVESAAGLLGVSCEALIRVLEPAVDRGLLGGTEAGSGLLFFRHEVVQEGLYSTLDLVQRSELHARMATSLEKVARDEQLAELALHRVRSLPIGNRRLALRELLEAAQWAERHLAFGQACDLLETALRISEEGQLSVVSEVALRLRLGACLVRAGGRERGREVVLSVLEAAQGLDSEALGEAALSLAPGFFAIEVGVCDSLLIEVLERALVAEEMAPSLRARLLARLAMALYWRPAVDGAEVSSLARRSEEDAEACGSPEVVAECGLWCAGARWTWQDADDRVAALGTETEADLLDPSSRMVRRVFLVAHAVEAGDRVSMEREVGRFELDAKLTREPHSQWYLPMYRGMQALSAGRLDVAREEVARLAEVGGRLGDANVGHCAVAQAAEIAFQDARAADLIPALRGNSQVFSRMPEYRAVVALFELASGELDAAHTMAVDVFREYSTPYKQSRLNSLLALSALAEIAFATNDRELGSGVLEAILPARRFHAVAGYGVLSWGSVARPIGYLHALEGRTKEARCAMADAIRDNREAGNIVWALHAELGLARVLARSGAVSAMRESRALASSLATESRSGGLSYLEQQALFLSETQ